MPSSTIPEAFLPIAYNIDNNIAFWASNLISHPTMSLTGLNHFSFRFRPINSLSTLYDGCYQTPHKTR